MSASYMDITPSSPGLGSSKYGTLVPNRIFVGGISSNTSEEELYSLFSKYGNVKATKIILDKTGISKGYGFITFETEEEAQRIQKEVEEIVLKDRKLNIAPAIKKQPFSRVLATDPAQMISNSTIIYPSTVPQSYNATVLNGNDNVYLPQAHYSVAYPQHLYLPQQYYQASSGTATYPAATQYLYAVPASSEVYAYGSAVPHAGSHSNDCAESSASDASEGGKSCYSKTNIPQPSSVPSDYDGSRMPPAKHGRMTSTSSYRGNASSSSSSIGGGNSIPGSNSFVPHYHPLSSQYLHHPILAKTASGVTVMAYPSPFMMGAQTILHVRDPTVGEHDNMTELAFFHAPLPAGSMTPPLTPLTPVACDFGAATAGEHGGHKN